MAKAQQRTGAPIARARESSSAHAVRSRARLALCSASVINAGCGSIKRAASDIDDDIDRSWPFQDLVAA